MHLGIGKYAVTLSARSLYNKKKKRKKIPEVNLISLLCSLLKGFVWQCVFWTIPAGREPLMCGLRVNVSVGNLDIQSCDVPRRTEGMNLVLQPQVWQFPTLLCPCFLWGSAAFICPPDSTDIGLKPIPRTKMCLHLSVCTSKQDFLIPSVKLLFQRRAAANVSDCGPAQRLSVISWGFLLLQTVKASKIPM